MNMQTAADITVESAENDSDSVTYHERLHVHIRAGLSLRFLWQLHEQRVLISSIIRWFEGRDEEFMNLAQLSTSVAFCTSVHLQGVYPQQA